MVYLLQVYSEMLRYLANNLDSGDRSLEELVPVDSPPSSYLEASLTVAPQFPIVFSEYRDEANLHKNRLQSLYFVPKYTQSDG